MRSQVANRFVRHLAQGDASVIGLQLYANAAGNARVSVRNSGGAVQMRNISMTSGEEKNIEGYNLNHKDVLDVSGDNITVALTTAQHEPKRFSVAPTATNLTNRAKVAGSNTVTGAFTDGQYIYTLDGTATPKINRIPLSNWASGTMDTWTIPGIATPLSLAYDGKYVYIGTNETTGKIWRADLSQWGTGTWSSIAPDASGGPLWCMVVVGKYLYAPTKINTAANGRVVQVDLDVFTNGGCTVVDFYNAGGNPSAVSFGAITACTRYLYISSVANGVISRIDTTNFAVAGYSSLSITSRTAAGPYSGLSCDDKYIYVSMQFSNSYLVRILISDFATFTQFSITGRIYKAPVSDGKWVHWFDQAGSYSAAILRESAWASGDLITVANGNTTDAQDNWAVFDGQAVYQIKGGTATTNNNIKIG